MSKEYVENKQKILHFTSRLTGIDETLPLFLKGGEIAFERLVVDTIIAFQELVQEELPDVVLIDHTPQFNYSSAALEVLGDQRFDLPVILLIDPSLEEEALNLFKQGVDDYIFLDRPARLPICIRKITKKYRFKREGEQLKNRLVQNERKFRSLIENSSDGIIILRPDGSNSYISPSVEKILHYTEKEAGKINFYSLVHPLDQQLVEEGVQACFEMPGLPLFGLPVRIKTQSGSYCWLETTFTNLIKDPAVGGLVVNFRDISQYKKAELAIRESEEKYRSFFEHSLDGILLTVTDGQILAANPAICRMLGMTEDEICRAGRFAIVDSGDERVGKAIKERRAKGHVKAEVTFIRKDGSKFPVELTSSVFLTAHGEKRTSMIVRDLSEKKKAEEEKEAVLQELRDKSIKLLTAQRIAKLGYWEKDLRSEDLYWTEEVYRIWCKKRSEFSPSIDEFIKTIHPEDLENFLSEYTAALAGSKNLDVQHRIILPNGSVKWVHERGSLSTSLSGQKVFKGTVQDITESKKSLEKLVTSEARVRGILKSQTSYLIRVDMEGKYSYCNDKFLKDFGWLYEGQNVIGQDSLSSIMDYHHERLAKVCEKCIAQPGEGFQVELDKPGRNNTVKTTLWDVVFLRESGPGGEIQCMGIDISDRVKVERENSFQANLLDKIGQAVIATDPKGKITYWNKAAKEIYGWQKEEVLGKDILEVTPSKVTLELGKEIMKSLKKGKTWTGEYEVKKKNGMQFPASVTTVPFYNNSGELKGYIGISSDITERKIAENKLQTLNRNLRKYTSELVAANKGLEQFSYIVSHNLRAPVANILGLEKLINTEEYPEQIKERLLQETFSNIRRLDTIVTDLNDILQVKIDLRERKEMVDLEKLIRTIRSGIRQIIEGEQVKIRTNFSEVPELRVTRSYLHSIFYNLLMNSIKYRRPDVDPVIEIKSQRKGKRIQLEFSDNGLGIDLGKRGNQVFGLYKRFHSHVPGKGMGLFMVKTQVEIMGGKIEVFSEVGKGTRFLMEFNEENQYDKKEDDEEAAVSVS
ncbi:PAS domain S-box protein [Salinimicrobium sp. HB62]|uniref:PAS domain S-box protein n=1 Tax=Salinimicrobium sp. HB62 TaxID=3077781 RepID=UPI002D76548B|nr:PAS domain S-box protein [Salinimicrobium sp. HB62]